jgi:biopolymer transport protein ExbD
MMTGVPLQLPKTSATSIGQPREPIIVSVTRGGEVYLGDEQVSLAELPQRLARLRAGDAPATVYVRGDKALSYGRVMQVIGLVNRAGFAKVSLIAEGVAAPTPVKAR